MVAACIKIHFVDIVALYAVHERLLRTSDDFALPVEINSQGRFTIDVEFLDLKISPLDVRYLVYVLYKNLALEPVSSFVLLWHN